MAETNKVYDGAEGAQAPDANERSEDNPGGSYIWALVIGSMIDAVNSLMRRKCNPVAVISEFYVAGICGVRDA